MDLNDVTKCHSIMFADDTNYIISSDSANEAIRIANTELDKTLKYANANKLLINLTKTSLSCWPT